MRSLLANDGEDALRDHCTNPIRYRKPYAARHSSKSWDLMIGVIRCGWPSNTATACSPMSRTYAAWTADCLESDHVAIREAIDYVNLGLANPSVVSGCRCHLAADLPPAGSRIELAIENRRREPEASSRLSRGQPSIRVRHLVLGNTAARRTSPRERLLDLSICCDAYCVRRVPSSPPGNRMTAKHWDPRNSPEALCGRD